MCMYFIIHLIVMIVMFLLYDTLFENDYTYLYCDIFIEIFAELSVLAKLFQISPSATAHSAVIVQVILVVCYVDDNDAHISFVNVF